METTESETKDKGDYCAKQTWVVLNTSESQAQCILFPA